MSVWNNLGKVFYAPFDVVFSEIDIVQPDILYISKENLDILTDENVKGAPDLVVEILSPSSEYRDKVIKRKLYGRYGVKEYGIVDLTEKKIEIVIRHAEGLKPFGTFYKNDTLKSSLLKELEIKLEEIF